MKTCMVSLFGAAGAIVGCSSCASAFAFPSNAALAKANAAPTRAAASAAAASTSNRRLFPRVMVRETALSAEKKDGEEQEPMDLDLEQMFEVFEAADKEVSDEEVGKKGGKKPDAKDPAEAMGDMLSSFFGGGEKK